MVVGWYHSHPGFGCWLSGVDVNTQQSFEQLNPRAVAVVVDPIQSVKGKVVIDAFRCISPQLLMMGQEPRQTTSVVGHLAKPSIQALIHGLNRHYYSIAISYRKNELEEKVRSTPTEAAPRAGGRRRACVRACSLASLPPTHFARLMHIHPAHHPAPRHPPIPAPQMLMNLHKRKWTNGLTSAPPVAGAPGSNEAALEGMATMAAAYASRVSEEEGLTASQAAVAGVGKVDPKKRLEADVSTLLTANIHGLLGTMMDTMVF